MILSGFDVLIAPYFFSLYDNYLRGNYLLMFLNKMGLRKYLEVFTPNYFYPLLKNLDSTWVFMLRVLCF